MRRLGEILLDHGYTSVDELHTALEACHRYRSRLGTQLLRLGFVTEKQLLEGLSEQTGRPSVPREIVDATSDEVLEMLPYSAARRLGAVPFARIQREMHVAFINPTDEPAIEEVRILIGLDVEPFVVTEATLTRALKRLKAVTDGDEPTAEETASPASVISSEAGAWDAVQRPTISDLLALPDTSTSDYGDNVEYATFPALIPVVDPASVSGPDFLDEAGLKEALCIADDRDAVGQALLSYAARFLTRLCLFSVFKNQAHGWLVEGLGPVLEDVQAFSIDLGVPSILATAARAGRHHEGPMPQSDANEAIGACLGDPGPQDLVVIPVGVQGRVVAFLMGDIPGQTTIGLPVEDLTRAADVTGLALEMMIVRRKIGKLLDVS